jgi:hypothetical protein
MSENEIEKVENNQNYLLAACTNEVNDEMMFRSDCRTCSSQYRKEAEEKFETTGSSKAAYVFLASKGEKISYHAVRRHMINHFQAQERNLMLKEYAKKVGSLMKHKYDRRQQLSERIAIMQSKIYDIEALSEGAELKDLMASADAIKKLSDSIAVSEKELDTLDKDMEPAKILVKNLTTIIKEEMSSAINEEVKLSLDRVFDKLINSIKNIRIEK